MLFIVQIIASDKKHSKTKPDDVSKESSNYNSSDHDEDNYLEFVVNRSVIVSNVQLQVMHVNEDSAKLKIAAVAEMLEWVVADDLHHQCIGCLETFYKIDKDSPNFHQQQLAVSLKLKSMLRQMRSTIANKFDALHEDLAQHVDAIGQLSQIKWTVCDCWVEEPVLVLTCWFWCFNTALGEVLGMGMIRRMTECRAYNLCLCLCMLCTFSKVGFRIVVPSAEGTIPVAGCNLNLWHGMVGSG